MFTFDIYRFHYNMQDILNTRFTTLSSHLLNLEIQHTFHPNKNTFKVTVIFAPI